MKNPRAVDIAIDCLDDELTVGLAIRALKRLKAGKAKEKIVPLLSHPDAWVRKEAKKYLEKSL